MLPDTAPLTREEPPNHHNVECGDSSDRFWTFGPGEGQFANTGARRGALTRSQPDDTGIDFVHWTDDVNATSEVQPLPMSSAPGVDAAAMEAMLTGHPNRPFVDSVLRLLREGLILGAKGYDASIFRRHKNLRSSLQHPLPVRSWLRDEVSRGRVYRYASSPHPRLQVWGLGAVEKRGHNIDVKARVITHFSKDWPDGQASLNECVDTEESTLVYPRTVNAVDSALQFKRAGGDVWGWATDLRSAFRILRMHPSQIHLQGMCFPDEDGSEVWYCDAHAGFGARRTPRAFNTVSQAIHFIILDRCEKAGIKVVVHHLLDDFLGLSPSEENCRRSFDIATSVLRELCIEIVPDKTTSPRQQLTFLGIDFDFADMTLSIPKDKRDRLLALLEPLAPDAPHFKMETKKLASLIGQLGFCQVAFASLTPSRCTINK